MNFRAAMTGHVFVALPWINVSVERQSLGWLNDEEATAEGFRAARWIRACDEFVTAWGKINGRYDPAAMVWRIGLERIQ